MKKITGFTSCAILALSFSSSFAITYTCERGIDEFEDSGVSNDNNSSICNKEIGTYPIQINTDKKIKEIHFDNVNQKGNSKIFVTNAHSVHELSPKIGVTKNNTAQDISIWVRSGGYNGLGKCSFEGNPGDLRLFPNNCVNS